MPQFETMARFTLAERKKRQSTLQESVSPMKSKLGVFGFVVLCVAAASASVLWSGADASQFADLKDPRVTALGPQKVIAVHVTGDPSLVASKAFSLLFSTYYRLEGVSRIGKPPAPRARWQFAVDTSRPEWKGAYALAIPPEVTSLPS